MSMSLFSMPMVRQDSLTYWDDLSSLAVASDDEAEVKITCVDDLPAAGDEPVEVKVTCFDEQFSSANAYFAGELKESWEEDDSDKGSDNLPQHRHLQDQQAQVLQALVIHRLGDHDNGALVRTGKSSSSSKKRQREPEDDTPVPQQGLKRHQPLTKSTHSTLEVLRFSFKPKRSSLCPFKKMRKQDWKAFQAQIEARAPSAQWFDQWQTVLDDVCQTQVIQVRFVVCISNAGKRQIYIHSGDLYQATIRAPGNCSKSGTVRINQFNSRNQMELKKHFSHDDTWLTSWEKIRDESYAIQRKNPAFFKEFLGSVAAVLGVS